MNRTLTLAGAEGRLVLREPPVLVFGFLFPPLTMLVLGGVFGATPDEAFGGVAPTNYYVAAYLGVTLAVLGLVALPVTIAAYTETGVMRRFAAFGVSPRRVITAQAAVNVVLALIGSVLVLMTAALTYGIPTPADPVGVVIGFAAAAIVLVTIGGILGVISHTSRGAQGIGLTVFFPMYLLGGGGPPPGAMTETMADISNVLPLTHAIAAMQRPWLGTGSATNNLLAVAGWTAVGAVVLALLLRRRNTSA